MNNDATFEHLLFTIYKGVFHDEYMISKDTDRIKLLLSETFIVAPNTPINVKFYLSFLPDKRLRLEFEDETFDVDYRGKYSTFVETVEKCLERKFGTRYTRDYFVYFIKYKK